MENYVSMLGVVATLIGVAEVIVRMTPTESDDGAVMRIGGIVKKLLDFLKIPNKLKDNVIKPE